MDNGNPAGHPIEAHIPSGDLGEGGLDLDGGDGSGRPKADEERDDPAPRAQIEELVRPLGADEISQKRRVEGKAVPSLSLEDPDAAAIEPVQGFVLADTDRRRYTYRMCTSL